MIYRSGLEQHPPLFHAAIYTLDALLPLINLGAREGWATRHSAQYTTALCIVVGWILATLFVGGITGLVLDSSRRSPHSNWLSSPGTCNRAGARHFAVVLDDRLIDVPAIDYTKYPEGLDAAYGSEIYGDFTVAPARSLASDLRTGPLPVRLVSIKSKATQSGDATRSGAPSVVDATIPQWTTIGAETPEPERIREDPCGSRPSGRADTISL